MEDVPNEILRTPDWLVDHRGGRLRRLHARFGGALCGVHMRRDAYAGMCWLIDGAEVPLSAVRRSGRPAYTGRFSANGLALALSLSYAANGFSDISFLLGFERFIWLQGPESRKGARAALCPRAFLQKIHRCVSHMPQKLSMGSLPLKASGPAISSSTSTSSVAGAES